VRQRGFDRQFECNQVANHAGNVVVAALSGWLGWRYGFGAVFALSAAFGILSLIAVAMIRADAIDHDIARGLGADGSTGDAADTKVSGLRILLQCRPLIVLAAALALFSTWACDAPAHRTMTSPLPSRRAFNHGRHLTACPTNASALYPLISSFDAASFRSVRRHRG
jgi:hypothetical protein